MTALALLDPEVIATLSGMSLGGSDFLATMVTMYLETTPQLLETLQRAVVDGDLRAIQRASHDLKSSSATLGAGLLASRCLKLESLARSGTITGAAELVADILEGFAAVRPELEALLPA
jgi:two-component system sensor histidine kinase/response regulator